jgi:butyrate kinase
MATVVSGKVDAIALTGGLAAWGRLVDDVTARCSFIAPVMVFPGENEMEALAWGAIRVLTGQEEAREYSAAPAL